MKLPWFFTYHGIGVLCLNLDLLYEKNFWVNLQKWFLLSYFLFAKINGALNRYKDALVWISLQSWGLILEKSRFSVAC